MIALFPDRDALGEGELWPRLGGRLHRLIGQFLRQLLGVFPLDANRAKNGALFGDQAARLNELVDVWTGHLKYLCRLGDSNELIHGSIVACRNVICTNYNNTV